MQPLIKVRTVAATATLDSLRLIAVDPAAFQQLQADSPLQDAPRLSRLEDAGEAVPVLLGNADPRRRTGKPMTLAGNGAKIRLDDAGMAPAIDADGEGFLIVDLAAYTAAMAQQDVSIQPNTVWVDGPRAQQSQALRES